MSQGYFCRAALSIDIAGEFLPFKEHFIFEPAFSHDPRLRIYMHELLHFWQVLSLSYITRIALAEWEELQRFEKTGLPSTSPPKSINFYQKHPKLGFSVWNLHEALCRYWDVHILGPHILLKQFLDDHPEESHRNSYKNLNQYLASHKEEDAYSDKMFDAAMSLDTSGYASPYLRMKDALGSLRAATLFPLVGYFALQSPVPLEVFAQSIEALKDYTINPKSDPLRIEEEWLRIYPQTAGICRKVCKDICSTEPESSIDVMEGTELQKNPVYAHYLQLLRFWQHTWGDKMNIYFALPGRVDCRRKLASTLRPPVVRFDTNRWLAVDVGTFEKLYLKEIEGKDVRQILDTEGIAEMSEDIDRRYRKMRLAKQVSLS